MTGPKWPNRVLFPNLGDIYSFENNDNAWSSLQQLAGRGSDYLGIEYEWDKSAWGRIAQTTALLYLSTGFEYYKHETAHEMFDGKPKFGIDFTDWGILARLQSFPYPIYTRKPYPAEPKKFIPYVAGLNSDEYTSFTTWKRCMLRRERTFDDSIYFLIHKLDDAQYFIYSEIYSYDEQKPLSSDPDTYIYKLKRRGIKLDKDSYGWQIAVSDLFSWYVGESIYSLANYLVRGKRSGRTASLSLTDDVAITPPLTNLYLTEKGSFFNISTWLYLGENSLEFSIGVDSDFIGGRLDTMRFGAGFYGLRFDPVEINPFAALDLERSTFDPEGFSSGLEVLLNVTSSAAIRAKLEYNIDDVLENMVKGEPGGTNAVVGIDVKI